MPHPRLTGEEIERRGEQLYRDRLREQLETDPNVGKLLSIDVESGDYEIGDDLIATTRRLLMRHPGAAIWTRRIGYNAVYALGGTLTRTDR
jgi:hypothetical protein